MDDAYETPFDRDETPFDGDEDTCRLDAALDRLNVRLVEMEAHLTRIEALIDDGVGGINRQLDDIKVKLDWMLSTRVLAWYVVGLSLEIIIGFGLVLWWC
jgi:hypothetical protein